MSDPSATHDQRSTSTSTSASIGDAAAGADGDEQRRLERAFPTVATPVRRACFWGTILLPFLHVPLLLSGLVTPLETVVFFGLLSINVVALYVGHTYEQASASR